MADKLTEFLRARNGPPPDLERREEWIDALRKLYAQVGEWLSEAKAEGLVSLSDNASTAITEEKIGTYDAPALQLFFGDQHIVLRPIGRFVVGGKGRVDVVRGARRAMLVRLAVEGWTMIPVNAARDIRVPLNKDSFTDAVKALLE